MFSGLQTPSQGKPGLACLVLAATEQDDDLLLAVAEQLGYEKRKDETEPRPDTTQRAGDETGSGKEEPTADGVPPLKPATKRYLPFGFWRIAEINHTGEDDNADEGKPAWLDTGESGEPIPEDTVENVSCRVDWPSPLLAIKRLWPMLINDLSASRRTNRPDIKKIVCAMAQLRSMPKMVKLEKQHWSNEIHIIVDTDSRLTPFRSDCMRLVSELRERVGRQRLRVLHFSDYPGGNCEGWYLDNSAASEYRPPSEGGRVLILSDLGVLERTSGLFDPWLSFLARLKDKQVPVYLFTPAAISRYSHVDRRATKLQPWDEKAGCPRHIGALHSDCIVKTDEQQLELLKVLLSSTSLFDPALVRKFRLLFLSHAPPELESYLWQQSDVFIFQGAKATWQPDRLDDYREKFRKLGPQEKEKALKIRDSHFRDFPSDFKAVQTIISASSGATDEGAAHRRLQQLMQRLYIRGTNGKSDSTLSFLRFFLDNQDSEDWHRDHKRLLSTAFYLVHKKELEQGKFPDKLPRGWQPSKNCWHTQPDMTRRVTLLQQQNKLVCRYVTGSEETPPDSPGTIGEVLEVAGPGLWRSSDGRWHDLGDGCTFTEQDQPVQLDIGDGRRVGLDLVKRSQWASSIGRDSRGLFMELESMSTPRLYWQNPKQVGDGHWSGFKGLGRDQYGFFGDVDVKGVSQRFRWCEPGTFMMGSPEDEPERLGKTEAQHEVTLSHGFWLADTAVTQALWQVVMGDNPSKFIGAERPVDRVSWDNAQKFIKQLNILIPELGARLPWEAEWEYGCRAGTTTPFSFGATITTAQVNFNGNYPYKDGRKGDYCGETVDVKSLPCNDWGLCEMHGNVWEWCGDFYEPDLGAAPVVDPKGPEKGVTRVVRGGSWFNDGRFVRSAIRDHFHPSYRDFNRGFRLARGH